VYWDEERFKKMFPNLYQEIMGSNLPTVLDHLEKCKNESEANDIIEYFERTGEITHEYANYLKNNLKKLGILGSRKAGEYEKYGLR